MKVKIQVVTITDDGQETITDIACVERHDLTPETLGLSLAEGKAVLQALQEVVTSLTAMRCGIRAAASMDTHTKNCAHDHP